MNTLKIKVIGVLFLLGFISVGLQLGNPHVAEAAPKSKCTMNTLNGTYMFEYNGFAVTPSFAPFIGTGMEVYNGDGTMSGIFSGNKSGTNESKVTYNGKYTVNSDCTGKLTITVEMIEEHYDLYIDPDGKQFKFIGTDVTVISGTSTRVSGKKALGN